MAELERRVIEQLTRASGREPWSLFVALDDCFERIAASGDARLARS